MESPLMSPHEGLLYEARDRIAALEAENARLTAALSPFARLACQEEAQGFSPCRQQPLAPDCPVCAARAALAAHGGGK